MLVPRLLLLLLVSGVICLATVASAENTTLLPVDEVEALKQVAETLGKKDWNFSADICKGESNWITPNASKDNTNAVSCDCSFPNNTCHVVSIILKSQNLSGMLPPELTNLPFLREIDLTRNYLNGTIPKEWGSMQLVNISLIGNRISGPIPKELGNISTLANLTLEYNQLNGTIPPELGNLLKLERLFLTSNYLTGELPAELSQLTSLRELRVSDNQLNGSIPNFTQNWANLQKLYIQASGLSGPIPSCIASLTNLTDLRISDLSGNDTSFPDLSGATNLKTLILRNCNITGQLPGFLASMTKLKMLDLSFNKLTGPIPENFGSLYHTDFIFMTGNFFSGAVPDWMLNEGQAIDLSYNNFTADSNCQPRTTNLFASTSEGNTSGLVSCLRNNPNLCPKSVYSIHINCGGRQVRLDNGTTYEEDIQSGGPSNFFQSRSNWAVSSTGSFLDNALPSDTYLWNSSTISGNNIDLYRTARLSPLSLTYYVYCLANGNYTVNLHFAEIMFSGDRTYASLGRRFFDIYIQGKLVKKDFNIETEAGGVNIPIVRSFTAVVTDNTLEIRFFWAGKGTTGIPFRGVYGPLISAISVISDSAPPSDGNSLHAGAVAGIIIAALSVISLVVVILWWRGCFPWKDSMENYLKGLDLHVKLFTLKQIKAATNNFDAANNIGEGGFGPVYKGHLKDGTIIAVKQLSSKSKQGNREFLNEIGMISALQHPNLVKLYGCCIEGNQLLLVYEYMENNSLSRALFANQKLELDWPKRHNISIGIARGLAYLHEESSLKIVHRDIKAANVLLDKDLNPKISDFGIAKLDEEENTHISTRITGTTGYMAPEYALNGHLTDKADVYSFGVVLLEIVNGRCTTSIRTTEDCFNLTDWANQLEGEGKLMDLIDPRLGSNYNEEEVMRTIHVALLCTSEKPTDRPSMSSAVRMLEGRGKKLIEELSESRKRNKSDKIRALKLRIQQLGVPFTASTTSASTSTSTASPPSPQTNYPISMGTDYLEERF
ncbi:OLC1v1023299C2 [Oldenlandia corymbosa var. corymbosa]|uniref:non-specific serine/threonine protein kinase n=2 Tax=Oldenlandia corymbosa var. corymbosa TaxID=529605 RepID=A0AAV1C0I2_OLDCO|nr:OLC1v1023299C2 [Oldenlandia corymbosa var. corymbosa]